LTSPRRDGREHTFRPGPAGVGTKLDPHGNARRPDRDGRFPEYPDSAVAAAFDHARDRDYSGDHRHGHLRREGDHEPARIEPGDFELAVELRCFSSRNFYER